MCACSLRDLLVNGGIVERVVYVSGENAPSRETVHYTAPEENATATHLCVVCVGVWCGVWGVWCVVHGVCVACDRSRECTVCMTSTHGYS